MPDPAPYLSVREVAARLGLAKVDAVLRLIHSGALPAANISSGPGRPTWRVAEADLAAWLDRRRAVPLAPVARRRRRAALSGVTRYF